MPQTVRRILSDHTGSREVLRHEHIDLEP